MRERKVSKVGNGVIWDLFISVAITLLIAFFASLILEVLSFFEIGPKISLPYMVIGSFILCLVLFYLLRGANRFQVHLFSKKKKRLIADTEVLTKFIELEKYHIKDKRDYSLAKLNQLTKSNLFLDYLRSFINEDIKQGIVQRSNLNMIDYEVKNLPNWINKSNLSNIVKVMFILKDSLYSPFFFALLRYQHPSNISDSKPSFDIVLFPDSEETLSRREYSKIGGEQVLQLYQRWKLLTFMYESFTSDEDHAGHYEEDRLSEGQVLLLNTFLSKLHDKVIAERNSSNTASVSEVVELIIKAKNSLESKPKSKIREYLKQIREKLLWAGRDFIWDDTKNIIRDLAEYGIQLLG